MRIKWMNIWFKYIHKNESDKVCFTHDAVYAKIKHLGKRSTSYKFLKNRAYKIALNPKQNRYHRGSASMVYKFLIS